MSVMHHLSHSSVSTFEDCGEKFRLTKLVKVPEVPGWALVGGSAVHSATEELDRIEYGVPAGRPDTFLGAFEAEVSKRLLESEVPEDEWKVSGKKSVAWPLKETKDWWLFHGQSFVDNYVGWRNRFPGEIWITPDGLPAIEIEINATFGGAPVLGYIDRIFFDNITRSLRVVDIKAGRTTPIDPAQLAGYAWGLPDEWPRPTHGSYFMARDGVLVGNHDLRDSKPMLDYKYGGAWNAINVGFYPAKASFMCGYCSVKEYCWLQKGALSDMVKPF